MELDSIKQVTSYGVLGIAVVVQFVVLGKLWAAYQNLQERYNAKSDTFTEKLLDNAREARALAADVLSRSRAKRGE